MLERKAKVEPEHAEPVLLAAASAEDDDIGIRLLHKHKARIDVRGEQQRTALMTAAQAGLLEVTAVLLELGAQINAEDENGQTAFMLAAQNGEVEVLNKLLESAEIEPSGHGFPRQNRSRSCPLERSLERGRGHRSALSLA